MTDAGRTSTRVHRPRRFRWAVWFALAYAVAAIVALASWAVFGDPAWLQPVNLTTFWWGLPAVVMAPLALLLGSRRSAALLAVPALAWLWSYGTAFLPNGELAEPDLRVATYNTFVGAPDASHVVRLVEEQRPDILLVEEVFPDREAELGRALATTLPESHVVQSPGVGGVGVYSRYPILEVRPVVDATSRSRSTAVIVLDVDGQPVQVVPVHLISPCPTCGPSLVQRVELEGAVRRAEIDAVLDVLDPSVPTIVGGDFNSTDRSLPYRALTGAGFDDPQRDAGSGPGFTWPNSSRVGSVVRIDWILVRGLGSVGAYVAPGNASDHRPVVVDLTLPEPR